MQHRAKIMDQDESKFDVSRAELFEALGHHTRITILQALGEKPMGFSDLKKKTGIESSGLLSFHLGKLTHLVTTTQDGNYTLTDQGKEAVRMIQVTKGNGGDESAIKVRSSDRRPYLVIIGVFLAVMIALGGVAVYQQGQLAALSNPVQPHNLVLVYGTATGGASGANAWVSGISVTSHSSHITFTSSTGGSVTAVPNEQGQYWATLEWGQRYNVTAYWQESLSCTEACSILVGSTVSVPASGGTVATCPAGGCQSPPGTFTSGGGEVSWTTPSSTIATGTWSCYGAVLDLTSSSNSYSYNPVC